MKTTKTSFIPIDDCTYEVTAVDDVGDNTRVVTVWTEEDQFVVEATVDFANEKTYVQYAEEDGEVDYSLTSALPPKSLAVWLIENWLENG